MINLQQTATLEEKMQGFMEEKYSIQIPRFSINILNSLGFRSIDEKSELSEWEDIQNKVHGNEYEGKVAKLTALAYPFYKLRYVEGTNMEDYWRENLGLMEFFVGIEQDNDNIKENMLKMSLDHFLLLESRGNKKSKITNCMVQIFSEFGKEEMVKEYKEKFEKDNRKQKLIIESELASKNNDHNRIIEIGKEKLSLGDDSNHNLTRIGKSYLQMGKWDEALGFLLRAKINGNRQIAGQIGKCYFMLGKYEDARTYVKEDIKEKLTKESLLRLSEIETITGNYELGLAYAESSLREYLTEIQPSRNWHSIFSTCINRIHYRIENSAKTPLEKQSYLERINSLKDTFNLGLIIKDWSD